MLFSKDALKRARKERALTQNELGDMVGVTGVTIMRYEKGERLPSYEMVSKLSQALGVGPFEFVSVGDVIADLRKDYPVDMQVVAIENRPLDSETTVRQYKLEPVSNQQQLLSMFASLNEQGQEEAIKRISDLLFNPKYCNKP